MQTLGRVRMSSRRRSSRLRAGQSSAKSPTPSRRSRRQRRAPVTIYEDSTASTPRPTTRSIVQASSIGYCERRGGSTPPICIILTLFCTFSHGKPYLRNVKYGYNFLNTNFQFKYMSAIESSRNFNFKISDIIRSYFNPYWISGRFVADRNPLGNSTLERGIKG